MASEPEHEYPCEAPFHVDGCDGKGYTRDHFTPKSIAKILEWTPKQIGDPMNIQHLSFACHKAKDRSTPDRLDLLRGQLRGNNISLNEYKKKVKEWNRFEDDL